MDRRLMLSLAIALVVSGATSFISACTASNGQHRIALFQCRKPGVDDAGRCHELIEGSDNDVEIRVDEPAQTVAISWTYGPPLILQDCKVFDGENWECHEPISPPDKITWSMHRGHLGKIWFGEEGLDLSGLSGWPASPPSTVC